MNLIAIMPTYGRPKLVASALWQFLRQDHPADQCRLLILDDLGQLSGYGPNWSVVSTPDRFPSLLAKYQHLYRLLDDFWPEWEAVSIMEDDDVYGPQWLSSHAACLADHRWSKPSQIYCTYGKDVLGGQPPFYETVQSVNGRFFASCAVRRDLMEQVGGFVNTTPQGQDLAQMAAWQQTAGPPGDTLKYASAQYCYAWGRANHVSGLHDWNDHKPMDSTKEIELTPGKDDFGDRVYQTLWVPLSTWEKRRRASMCVTCILVGCASTADTSVIAECPKKRWQPETNAMHDDDIREWMARAPSTGRELLPEITCRNTIYHCYPSKHNDLWRWQAERMAKEAKQFNGRRIVAIGVDDNAEKPRAVRKAFGDAFDFIEVPNDTRLREVASFRILLDTVQSTNPHEATFYGHSKGNCTGRDSANNNIKNNEVGAEFWARASYNVLLRNPDRIENVLRYWASCGINLMDMPNDVYTPFPSGLRHADWFYSGTFFWFRHDAVFSRNWSDIPDDRYGAEAWIGGVVDRNDAWSEYQAWDRSKSVWCNPYNPYCYLNEVVE